jgi:hypothetical protein
MSPQWSINLQGGYLWASTTSFELARENLPGEVDYWTMQFGGKEVKLQLDGATVGVGLNYHWK